MTDIKRQLLEPQTRIWIEPSFLLHEGFQDFWSDIQESLTASSNCLWLRRSSFEKIHKAASSTSINREERRRAIFYSQFIKEQYVSASPPRIRLAIEAPGQAFGLLPSGKGYVCSNFPRVTILTQENSLIHKLLSCQLAEEQEIEIFSLNPEGKLVRRHRQDELNLKEDYSIKLIDGRKPVIPGAFKPSNPAEKAIRSEQIISNKPSPVQGERLMAVSEDALVTFPITLGTEIGNGGEGNIYHIDNITSSVAKIYNPKHRSAVREQKIESLLKNRDFIAAARDHGICVPTSKLVDEDGLFVGFIMDKAMGQTLDSSAFQPRPTYEAVNSDWNRGSLIRLCQSILKSFSFLHQHQILMGDINPDNILVDSPDHVYFVDVDSYQFLQFPCEVGLDYYLAPELQYSSSVEHGGVKERRSSIRTFESEFFSIAVILFKIMIPGKFPYDQTGEEQSLQNLNNMHFPYPFRNHEGKNLPDGIWTYAWLSLPDEIQENFYNTFSRNGLYANPEMRLSPDEWLEAFNRYERVFPELMALDPMNGNIFPTRTTRKQKVTYSTCKKCLDEYPQDILYQGYCPQCLAEVVHLDQCRICGAEIPYTFRDQIDKKKKREVCEDCEQIERIKNGQRCNCKECGRTYWITDSERHELEARQPGSSGLCPQCRSSKTNIQSVPKVKKPYSQIDLMHFLDWMQQRGG